MPLLSLAFEIDLKSCIKTAGELIIRLIISWDFVEFE